MIKVSVIIPVYNVQAYIRECLDSLINQTLQDIEIVCINDCSSDNSLNIVQEYASKDDRIVVVNNEKNVGAGVSRNIGIHMAQGEYLAILDADDFFELNMLEIAYSQCINDNADIGIYDYAKYNNDSKSISNCLIPLYLTKKMESDVSHFKQTKGYIFQSVGCAPWNKMYKRQFVLESKIEFQDLKNANDVYFGIIILTKAKKITYVNIGKPLLYYRTNISTQISAHRQKHPSCIWEALMKTQETLIENGDFEYYRASFYAYAIDNLIYLLRCTDTEYQSVLYETIRTEWLKRLNMLNCEERDFSSAFMYEKYRNFLSGDFNENRLKEIMASSFLKSQKSEEIFHYLKAKNYRCGLWGIGLFGKAFLKVCDVYSYGLSCVIDEDIEKEGMKIGNYIVEPFIEVSRKVDAVIITNSRYGRDVVNAVNRVNPNIKIIDIGTFYSFGVKIDDCIL